MYTLLYWHSYCESFSGGEGINLSPIDVICAVGILVAEIPVCLLLEKISPAYLGKKYNRGMVNVDYTK